MDLQTYIQNAVKASRANTLANSDQLTLGELILKLEPIVKNQKEGEEATVRYDFEYLFPTSIEEWSGRVWLNPPYSNPKPFIKKLAEHGNGIALVLNSTDTEWFQEYGLKKANGMYLLKGRPKFTRMDMSPVSIMRGVVLFAYGEQNCQALKNCQLNGYYVGL
jgi:hypothetical protein